MQQGSPSILILGGGVAGMTAARSLDHPDLTVHLVEEQNQLGGKAVQWACMATDTCKNCGACLSHEMVHQVTSQNNVTLHLNTKINTLKKNKKGVEALLTSGKTVLADKMILATGFSPFDPVKLFSLHWKTCKNVITTAELNTEMRREGLSTLLNNTPTPKIAFLQCVGSRNKILKKDYCSQVCCKISLRHSEKLIHEIPDARITLFYMDLQIIGKEIRQTLDGLAPKIDLVQGVPAEILEDPNTGKITMVTEDRSGQSRITRQFDLVVLSVGMEPARDMDKTAALLNISPNDFGFFNTDNAPLPDDIYVSGCARGPKDILTSQQEGKITGAKVLKDLGLAEKPDLPVAILGDGPQAAEVTRTVAAQGYPVHTFGEGEKILAVEGIVGNFSIDFETQGKRRTLSCGAIIAAPEPCSIPNTGNKFQGAIGLDAFTGIAPEDLPEKNLILLDYFGPEFKVSARRALLAAMAAKKAGKEITIVMNKMLVHGGLGQRLYDQARNLGILFLRFNTLEDIQIQAPGFHIGLREATLPNLKLNLECDCLVLPESIHPEAKFESIATVLHSSLDRENFLQPANVRHRPTQSPRKGIFFAGSGHDEVDDQDLAREIQEILSNLCTLTALPDKAGMRINEKDCAKCLTCYRICPHSAIILDKKKQPRIMTDACFSCQLCLSNCPAIAIESDAFTKDQIAEKITDSPRGYNQVVIFACERSAILAADKIKYPDNIKMIPLPCACRINSNLILKALINGASKVIVSGCHEGNCRSMAVTTAKSEVTAVTKLPGITPDRITWEPVAANETDKFQRIISRA